MIGVVLAAGAGERMRPLSRLRPKPLLPILDSPMLGWAIARLAAGGSSTVFVNSHTEQVRIREAAESVGEKLGVQTVVSHEKEPLGTAGALHSFDIQETFVLTNADSVLDIPVSQIVEAHRSAKGVATLVGVASPDAGDFVVEEGWVRELIDRRSELKTGHRYTGLGVFEPEVLEMIPRGPSGLFETVMEGAMRESLGLSVFEWNGYFRDVGTPADHLWVNVDALSGPLAELGVPEKLSDRPERWDAMAYVGPGAETVDVELRHAIVGAGARIAGGSKLERCVVWEGVDVKRGEYLDSIFTGKRVVRI